MDENTRKVLKFAFNDRPAQGDINYNCLSQSILILCINHGQKSLGFNLFV